MLHWLLLATIAIPVLMLMGCALAACVLSSRISRQEEDQANSRFEQAEAREHRYYGELVH